MEGVKWLFIHNLPLPLELREGEWGIGSNLSFWSDEILDNKISPPFEGGVVGMIDYHIFTVFSFPTGVVDSRYYGVKTD
jgi:hypothetical protein